MTAENKPQFRLNVLQEVPSVMNPEQQEAWNWYNEQVSLLPEMKVERFKLTGEGGWEVRLTPENQAEIITGRHFNIEGRKVTMPTFGWNQPLIIQRSEELINESGEIDRISGIVLILTNPESKIFVGVVQEPGVKAQTASGEEVHPVVRTPFQGSIEKLQQLASGNEKVDPVLFSALGILSKDSGKDLSALVQGIPLKKIPTDGNRIESNVLYGRIDLTRETASLVSQRIPEGKFLSRHQLSTLPLNGHLHIALSVTS